MASAFSLTLFVYNKAMKMTDPEPAVFKSQPLKAANTVSGWVI